MLLSFLLFLYFINLVFAFAFGCPRMETMMVTPQACENFIQHLTAESWVYQYYNYGIEYPQRVGIPIRYRGNSCEMTIHRVEGTVALDRFRLVDYVGLMRSIIQICMRERHQRAGAAAIGPLRVFYILMSGQTPVGQLEGGISTDTLASVNLTSKANLNTTA